MEQTKALEYLNHGYSLSPPKNQEVRLELEEKLAEYKRRLEQWDHVNPHQAYGIPEFRRAYYKALVADIMLNTRGSISLKLLAESQSRTYGKDFDAAALLVACGVV